MTERARPDSRAGEKQRSPLPQPGKKNKAEESDKAGEERELGPGSELNSIPPDAQPDPLPPDAGMPGKPG